MANRQPGEFGYEDTSYLAMGGEEGIRTLVDHFYDVMVRRPDSQRILRMHPTDLQISRDKLTAFLCGWLGGPKRFNERFGPIKIPMAHEHLPIGSEERDAWLACMQEAVLEVDIADDFREYFMREIRVPADRVLKVCSGG